MKALIHRTTFLEAHETYSFFFALILHLLYFPSYNSSSQEKWEVKIPLYFLLFSTTFCSVEENQISFFLVFLVIFAIQ